MAVAFSELAKTRSSGAVFCPPSHLPHPAAKSWKFFQCNLSFCLFLPLHSQHTSSDFIISCLNQYPSPSPLHLTYKCLCFQYLHFHSILFINAKWNFSWMNSENFDHMFSLLRNLKHLSKAWQRTPNLFKDFYYLVPIYLLNFFSIFLLEIVWMDASFNLTEMKFAIVPIRHLIFSILSLQNCSLYPKCQMHNV